MGADAAPWKDRVREVAGALGATRPLGGNAWLVEAGGQLLVAKTGPGARDEAEGLRRIAAVPGAPPVPLVVLADAGLLVTTAVDQRSRAPDHDVDLGRSLAALHRAAWPEWGGGSSFIGACSVDPAPQAGAAPFYGRRLTELAARCGLERVVGSVTTRLSDLLPSGGPSLVHGDLWWGNVLFGADGRAWLIDPSVHGGHAEEDLAMLALFGPVPEQLLGAYQEVHTLHDGWRERIALFQLYPLLVHSVLFGGAYRDRAKAIAVRFS
jgi:fructosamine-3-kinase